MKDKIEQVNAKVELMFSGFIITGNNVKKKSIIINRFSNNARTSGVYGNERPFNLCKCILLAYPQYLQRIYSIKNSHEEYIARSYLPSLTPTNESYSKTQLEGLSCFIDLGIKFSNDPIWVTLTNEHILPKQNLFGEILFSTNQLLVQY